MDRKVLKVSSLSLTFSDYLSIYLCIYVSLYLSIYLTIDLSIYLPIYVSMYLCIYVFIYLSINLSSHLSIYPSIYLSPSLSLSLSLQDPPTRGGRRHQGASPFYSYYSVISPSMADLKRIYIYISLSPSLYVSPSICHIVYMHMWLNRNLSC